MLLFGAMMYAVFGGADFGAGLWELLAAAAAARRAVSERIDRVPDARSGRRTTSG